MAKPNPFAKTGKKPPAKGEKAKPMPPWLKPKGAPGMKAGGKVPAKGC